MNVNIKALLVLVGIIVFVFIVASCAYLFAKIFGVKALFITIGVSFVIYFLINLFNFLKDELR